MKRFLLLVTVMLSFGLTSCKTVATSKAVVIDEGQVVQVNLYDEEFKKQYVTSSIVIHSNYNNTEMKYHVPKYDWFWYETEFEVGDDVYIYKKRDGTLIASKLYLSEGRAIHGFLKNEWYDDIFSVKGLLVFVLVPIGLILLRNLGKRINYEFYWVFFIIIPHVACFTTMGLAFNSSARLEYVDEGYINSINQNKVTLENSSVFYLDNIEDIVYDQDISEEDYVYVYQYDGMYTKYYATQRELDRATYKMVNIYPNIYLGTALFFAISYAIWHYFIKILCSIFRCNKKKA